MKKILLLLFSLQSLWALAGNYVCLPPADGHAIISGSYTGNINGTNQTVTFLPGDHIVLKGAFKSIYIHLSGTSANPIYIEPDATGCDIGDATWAGGSYAEALDIDDAHWLVFGGSTADRSKFRVWGSLDPTLVGGVPVNQIAYFDFHIGTKSDNITVHNLQIYGGGTGIWCKTEVVFNGPSTWYEGTSLGFVKIDNVQIRHTAVEGMYLGHTANFWNVTTNLPLGQPYYPSNPSDNTAVNDTSTYKKPLKYRRLDVTNCILDSISSDAIQTSAYDSIFVSGNLVTSWALGGSPTDCGGILIGNRIGYAYVHDNIVHHSGIGEFVQVYAQGGGQIIVQNNLFYDNASAEAISIRPVAGPYQGVPAGCVVTVDHNTIGYSPGHGVRVNGFFDASPQPAVVTNNVFVIATTSPFPYLENGGLASVGSGATANYRYTTYAAAHVDSTNYYAPTAGWDFSTAGYRNGGGGAVPPPSVTAGGNQTITLPVNSVTLSGSATAASGHSITGLVWTQITGGSFTINSPNSSSTVAASLSSGVHDFRLTATQDDGQTAGSDVFITVNVAAPPSANAGADQSINLPTSSVSLSGSGVAASGYTITAYAWSKVSGAGGSITSPAAQNTTITGLTQGSYVFRVTVTQGDGQTATDDVAITVNSVTVTPNHVIRNYMILK